MAKVTPTTWNPADKGTTVTLSNGNLTVTQRDKPVRSVASVSTGKWYWEFTIGSGQPVLHGVANASASLATYVGNDANGWSLYSYNCSKYNAGVNSNYFASSQLPAGTVVGVKLDMDAGTLSFVIGGVDRGVAFSGLSGPLFAAVAGASPGADTNTTTNFGATAFTNSVPSGYNAGFGELTASHVIADRVKEQASTSGTGAFTLAGALAGFRSFASTLGENDTTWYCATSDVQWEIGLGKRVGSTLQRTSVLKSSNADALVNFSVPPTVFCTVPAVETALGRGPAFSAYMSGNQALPSGAFTLLAMDAEEYDTGDCYNNTAGNYRFQPTVPGYYRFTANLYLNPVSTGAFSLSFYKNGAVVKRGNQPNTAAWGVSLVATIYLNGTTDYVDCRGYASGAFTANGSSSTTYFQGEFVRGA